MTGVRERGVARARAGIQRRRDRARAWQAKRAFPGVFLGDPLLRGDVRLELTPQSRIGPEFHADGRVHTVMVAARDNGFVILGERIYLNRGASIEALHEIRIGDGVLFAPFASVVDDDFHPLEPGAPTFRGPTIVGDNVWLGRSVVVTPGVTIGAGTVVGANSVVTRDLPGNVLAVGSPARPVRELDVPTTDWDRHRRAPGYGPRGRLSETPLPD